MSYLRYLCLLAYSGVQHIVLCCVFLGLVYPMLPVSLQNIILYLLSWYRMHQETRQLKHSLGNSSQALRLSHRAAKTMSLFVVAFFVQWLPMSLYGIWQVIDDVPQLLFSFFLEFIRGCIIVLSFVSF
jgi:hypothetical protein